MASFEGIRTLPSQLVFVVSPKKLTSALYLTHLAHSGLPEHNQLSKTSTRSSTHRDHTLSGELGTPGIHSATLIGLSGTLQHAVCKMISARRRTCETEPVLGSQEDVDTCSKLFMVSTVGHRTDRLLWRGGCGSIDSFIVEAR
jgi:hypothetical protein